MPDVADERTGWQKALRAAASEILQAGVAAVEPRQLVREYLTGPGAELASTNRIHVVAIGKAAIAMAQGVAEVLADRVVAGVVVAPPGSTSSVPPRHDVFEGGHPIPSAEGVRGARAVRDLATGLGEQDTLLCLISGGGSALMTLPPEEVTLADVQETTERLLRAGATIGDLNCLRKHLDQLKGGRLAAAAAPARVEALVLSDVVGDPLDVIASGPVSPDPTTFDDVRRVLARLGIAAELPEAVRLHLDSGLVGREDESPAAGDRCFDRVAARVIGSNRIAAAAAVEAATGLGFAAELLTTEQVGEARRVGADLVALGLERDRGGSRGRTCLVAAGETTVTVLGKGKGGRNQELALGAALALDGSEGVLVASMGTDGIDGPTDAAGAVADGRTRARAETLGIDLAERLADNDSYSVFEALEDLILIGPTGTNVMDLMLLLADSREE